VKLFCLPFYFLFEEEDEGDEWELVAVKEIIEEKGKKEKKRSEGKRKQKE
jgi:hypothetical protein